MALHTAPTLNSITIEGLKTAGYPNTVADDTLQTRAEDWVQEFYADLHNALRGRRLKPLMVTSYALTTIGVSRYAMPADFNHDFTVSILYGNTTGTASAGGASTIDTAANISSSDYGKLIVITGGTGAGSASQIVSHSGATVTVSPAWAASPANGSTYMIIDSQYKLDEDILEIRDNEQNPYIKNRPTHYFPLGQANADSDETGEIELYPVPDKVYALQLRYYVNLNLLDLTNDANILTTIYRRWQSVIKQKVIYLAYKSDNNDKAEIEERTYWRMVKNLIATEEYGANLSNMQAEVEA